MFSLFAALSCEWSVAVALGLSGKVVWRWSNTNFPWKKLFNMAENLLSVPELQLVRLAQHLSEENSWNRAIQTCNMTFWVNYYDSLTWIKAIWGWFPLLTFTNHHLWWGHNEVVIIYPHDIFAKVPSKQLPTSHFHQLHPNKTPSTRSTAFVAPMAASIIWASVLLADVIRLVPGKN